MYGDYHVFSAEDLVAVAGVQHFQLREMEAKDLVLLLPHYLADVLRFVDQLVDLLGLMEETVAQVIHRTLIYDIAFQTYRNNNQRNQIQRDHYNPSLSHSARCLI